MIILSAIWSYIVNVPTKLKLYAGAALVIIIALLRWRAAGINAALEEVRRKDAAKAQRLRERVAVARSNHPDGDNDIIERLREHNAIRLSELEPVHGTQTRSSDI